MQTTPMDPYGFFAGRMANETRDAAGIADRFRALMAEAKMALPDKSYGERPLQAREVTLHSTNGLSEGHLCADLIMFAAAEDRLAQAIIGNSRFSSRYHSLHGEWVLMLRIPRSEIAPFDDVDDRNQFEESPHAALSAAGLGGHGRNAIYVVLALADIGQAIERIGQVLARAAFAQGAMLHFLDQGLGGAILTAVPDHARTH